MNVAIQPARERRSKESDYRKRKEVNCSEMKKEWITKDEGNNSKCNQNRAKNNSNFECQLDQKSQQVQSEQDNQRACNWRESRAVFAQERSHCARRRSKRNKNNGKSHDKRKR